MARRGAAGAADGPKVDRRAEAWARLETGLAGLTNAEAWRAYLAMQAKFHNYSFANTILLLTQNSECTRVAGFNTWKSLGRWVTKGQAALWVFAPSVRKARAEDGASAEAIEDGAKVLTYFVPVPVFDVSQTEGAELPARPVTAWRMAAELAGLPDGGLCDQLAAFAAAHGFEVRTVAAGNLDGALGVCDYSSSLISLADNLGPAERARVLAHEVAHMLCDAPRGFEARLSTEDRELRAESVSFMVLDYFGVPGGESCSFGYIAAWQGEHGKDAVKQLKELGRSIQQTAALIIEGCGGEAKAARPGAGQAEVRAA